MIDHLIERERQREREDYERRQAEERKRELDSLMNAMSKKFKEEFRTKETKTKETKKSEGDDEITILKEQIHLVQKTLRTLTDSVSKLSRDSTLAKQSKNESEDELELEITRSTNPKSPKSPKPPRSPKKAKTTENPPPNDQEEDEEEDETPLDDRYIAKTKEIDELLGKRWKIQAEKLCEQYKIKFVKTWSRPVAIATIATAALKD
jgi:hypothetical protein